MDRLLKKRRLGNAIYAVTTKLKTALKEEATPQLGEIPKEYANFLDVFKN